MASLHSVSVKLNGEGRLVPSGCTLLELLSELGRDPRTVAVEYNGAILPRSRYGEAVLHDGDRLEIVHFVQGG